MRERILLHGIIWNPISDWLAIANVCICTQRIHSLRDVQYSPVSIHVIDQVAPQRNNINVDHSCSWYWWGHRSLSMGHMGTTWWMWRVSLLSFIFPFVQLTLRIDRVCGQPPHAFLDNQSCTINYTANTLTPWAIALKIEDFEASSPTIALSGTSLQFIVQAYIDKSTCEKRKRSWMMFTMWWTVGQDIIIYAVPSYVGEKPDGSCVTLTVGKRMNEVAQFITECENETIVEVEMHKPSGGYTTGVPFRTKFALLFRPWTHRYERKCSVTASFQLVTVHHEYHMGTHKTRSWYSSRLLHTGELIQYEDMVF